MSGKEYLSAVRVLNDKIQQDLKQLDRLYDLAHSVSSPAYAEHYSSGCNPDPPFVRYLSKIDKLERLIDKEVDEFVDMKRERKRTISKLNSENARAILTDRYLKLEPWDTIIARMTISESTIYRVHKRALEEIENFL